MFTVNETESAAIRTAFEQDRELPDATELCLLFPGIDDTTTARQMARVIAVGGLVQRWLPRA